MVRRHVAQREPSSPQVEFHDGEQASTLRDVTGEVRDAVAIAFEASYPKAQASTFQRDGDTITVGLFNGPQGRALPRAFSANGEFGQLVYHEHRVRVRCTSQMITSGEENVFSLSSLGAEIVTPCKGGRRFLTSLHVGENRQISDVVFNTDLPDKPYVCGELLDLICLPNEDRFAVADVAVVELQKEDCPEVMPYGSSVVGIEIAGDDHDTIYLSPCRPIKAELGINFKAPTVEAVKGMAVVSLCIPTRELDCGIVVDTDIVVQAQTSSGRKVGFVKNVVQVRGCRSRGGDSGRTVWTGPPQ